MGKSKVFILLISLVFCSKLGIAQSDTSLVEITKQCPNIILDIRYATPNNFTGVAVYPEAKAYARFEVVKKLCEVSDKLAKDSLKLVVFDAYRPLQVQYKFWQLLPDERYVANPKNGSRHNRGAAVDVTLADFFGNYLEMPTAFDDFSEKASPNYKGATKIATKNRDFLIELMRNFGFSVYPSEWWHFDFEGWEKYSVLDINFEDL
jgi:D-alanyl-D-alanine dipeptidase